LRASRPSTSGLAAGATVEGATQHAALEVIERYATSTALRRGEAALLDLDTVADDACRNCLSRFASAGIKVATLDFSEVTGIPCYETLTCGPALLGSTLLAAGQAADIIPARALRKSLVEAAQARVAAIHGGREDLVRYGDRVFDDANAFDSLRSLAAAAAAQGGTVALLPPSKLLSENVRPIEAIRSTISLRGFDRLIVTELTDDALCIPVVHVTIPGMRDFRTDGVAA
jgi:ribosomal protein S12 methylthiotransferase accessory factor